MKFTKETMQARLDEVGAEADAIMAAAAPLREKLADIVANDLGGEKAIREQIKTAEVGLYDLQVERGLLAKALGGRSMSSTPDAEAA